MKRLHRRLISIALAMALGATPPSFVGAEDIDLFVGGNPAAASNRPNVLIIIDNSANWSAASQHWVGGLKQGESELRSLGTVAGEVTENVNVGLMLLTPGTGTSPIFSPSDNNKEGAYVRFHMRQMNATNKAALQELIGTSTCVNGANSLNGTPNCLFKNFDTPAEKTSTNVDYSSAMFEAFKYFGGYTSPTNAGIDLAGTPVGPKNFGPERYSGNPDPKSDPAAYVNGATDALKRVHNPPIDVANNCAKNYIIFIGNGFPSKDAPKDLLTGVQGDATQLAMPQFTTTSLTQKATIGQACGTGSTNANRLSNCTANIPAALKTANPADSYACIGTGVIDLLGCPGVQNRKFDVQSSKLIFDVQPTGTSAVPATNKERYTDEWAKYLYTTDVNGQPGQQNVTTYTIDVFRDAQDGDATALLSSMAKHGGGRYYQASSEADILKALREIMIEIQATNSVFASASLPINATNRSQNENQVFIGMFRPDPDGKPRWYGNLRRYQIGLFGSTGTEARLADKNGGEAISGAFLGACAVSFWTTDTSSFDSSTFPPTDTSYWSFSPLSSGQCTLTPPGFTTPRSPFSDLPDGPLVEKGGTAEVVRLGNNPSAAPTFLENRTIFTCTKATACPDTSSSDGLLAFNTTNVSQSALGAADATEHAKLVDFARGIDVSFPLVPTEKWPSADRKVRPSAHGDVTHSRPLPVNYGGSNGVVVFYGAGDGSFRAVRGGDINDSSPVTDGGKELWAFIAPEHHSRFKRLALNSPLIQYPSTPPFVVPTPQKKEYFFDGSAGLFQTFQDPPNETLAKEVLVFPTMRRGGRMVQGFDVSVPTKPVLLWRGGCPNPGNDTDCVAGYEEMGQTWSFPNVAFVKGYSTTEPVIIMGGGYDSCEDEDTSVPSGCSSAKGRRVFVIEARSGSLVASFKTDASVIADVTLVDLDLDGLVDHGYVVDTAGNLYRVDFAKPGTHDPLAVADWSITKLGFTTGFGRKFQFGAAVLATSKEVFVAFGSGDRERPLEINYPFKEDIVNRFYMFRDKFPDPSSSPAVDLDTVLTDQTSASSACGVVHSINSLGWFMDLKNGRGEQTVTSAVIFSGLIFFSTNRPISAPPGACASNLGEASGYAVNLLNASGAVGTEAICGGQRSGIFVGGGLPPSPVTGIVPVGGKPVTIMIGGIQRSGGASSPIGAQKVKPSITPKRSRSYWYSHGDR